MNRAIASILIFLIFSMHSAWAIGEHVDSNHITESISHVENHYEQSMDNDKTEHCDEHGCHISAHATGLFSTLSLTLCNNPQSVDTSVKLSNYLHSQATPQRPPKV